MVAEYDVNDTTYTLLRKFRYGPEIDEPICMWRTAAGGGAGLFYYHYDGLGNVVAISDVNGTIVEPYEYDIFGAPTIYDYAAHQEVEESTVGNPYMFTGRRYDAETGLYYYRARYYEPYIGRFLQTDPIRYYDSMNMYEYCWNNPLNWIDPWGLQPYFPPGSVPRDYVPFPDKDVPPIPWNKIKKKIDRYARYYLIKSTRRYLKDKLNPFEDDGFGKQLYDGILDEALDEIDFDDIMDKALDDDGKKGG